jgi:hypothetical protein
MSVRLRVIVWSLLKSLFFLKIVQMNAYRLYLGTTVTAIFDTLIDLASKYVLTINTIEFCDIHTMKWTGSYDMSQVY